MVPHRKASRDPTGLTPLFLTWRAAEAFIRSDWLAPSRPEAAGSGTDRLLDRPHPPNR